MSIKRKLFDFVFNRANKFSCSISEVLDPIYPVEHSGEKYFFSCLNNLTRWRVETYFTKEPETIEWIDTFKSNEVLFDIGANMGLYSIYAAKRGVRVIAFEPESQNYALINKNLYLNKLSEKVCCLNIALSDKDTVDYLYIPVFQAGGAINCFGSATDWENKSFNPSFKQGAVSFSLDSFLSFYPEYFPAHIKIDVDGIEPKIIMGAKRTLSDHRLKSILIEINESLPEHMEAVRIIQSNGFLLKQKTHSEIIENSPFNRVFNYLFIR